MLIGPEGDYQYQTPGCKLDSDWMLFRLIGAELAITWSLFSQDFYICFGILLGLVALIAKIYLNFKLDCLLWGALTPIKWNSANINNRNRHGVRHSAGVAVFTQTRHSDQLDGLALVQYAGHPGWYNVKKLDKKTGLDLTGWMDWHFWTLVQYAGHPAGCNVKT